MAITKDNVKSIKIEDIIEWCKENNQTEWLKEIAATKVPHKVYPKKVNENGKKVADYSAEPTTKMQKITFIEIKAAFINKFMPELAPTKKEKKVTMFELIESL